LIVGTFGEGKVKPDLSRDETWEREDQGEGSNEKKDGTMPILL
jgi:hypothetical protein